LKELNFVADTEVIKDNVFVEDSSHGIWYKNEILTKIGKFYLAKQG